MTVRELYDALSALYPRALSAAWDNDGVMVSGNLDAPVRHVLCALDVTERTVGEAVRLGADLILSHHPLIFRPLASLTEESAVGRRAMTLLASGISVLSFHTRADAAEGGVNDLLAEALGLSDTSRFGDGDIGVLGDLPTAVTAEALAETVKAALGAPLVLLGDSGRPLRRVAVVGGSGKDEIAAAIAVGADALVSGRLSYETVNEAKELGITLIEAGHFFTEALLPRFWAKMIPEHFAGISATYYDSCHIIVK